jgi:hypothetical protein
MWVRPLDAYVGAERPSKVMVWTPEHTGIFLTHARGHAATNPMHLSDPDPDPDRGIGLGLGLGSGS